jgi:hypothetical protein
VPPSAPRCSLPRSNASRRRLRPPRRCEPWPKSRPSAGRLPRGEPIRLPEADVGVVHRLLPLRLWPGPDWSGAWSPQVTQPALGHRCRTTRPPALPRPRAPPPRPRESSSGPRLPQSPIPPDLSPRRPTRATPLRTRPRRLRRHRGAPLVTPGQPRARSRALGMATATGSSPVCRRRSQESRTSDQVNGGRAVRALGGRRRRPPITGRAWAAYLHGPTTSARATR